MKWLKLYTEIVKDPKIQLLAFEDRWHFVALMCAKADGILDEEPKLRDRLLRVHLGLSPDELINVRDRLVDVMLIDDDWHIYAWDNRQSGDALAAARQKRYRQRLKEKEEERSKNKEERERVTRNVTRNDVTPQHFEEFYSAYPKKVGKGAAEKAYKKISTEDHQLILRDLKRREWPERRFIPNPSTYVNQKRWLDEPETPAQATGGREFYV